MERMKIVKKNGTECVTPLVKYYCQRTLDCCGQSLEIIRIPSFTVFHCVFLWRGRCTLLVLSSPRCLHAPTFIPQMEQDKSKKAIFVFRCGLKSGCGVFSTNCSPPFVGMGPRVLTDEANYSPARILVSRTKISTPDCVDTRQMNVFCCSHRHEFQRRTRENARERTLNPHLL